MSLTVKQARDADLLGVISEVCGLSVRKVQTALRDAGDRTQVRNLIDEWPTHPDDLTTITVARALQLRLQREIAAVIGTTEAWVTRELENARGNKHVGNVFADEWPVEDDDEEEYDSDDDIDEDTIANVVASVDRQFEERELRVTFQQEFSFDLEYSRRGLRDYQEAAVKAVLAALSPANPQIMHLPTGAGKTHTANAIVRKWQEANRNMVLWVTKDWPLLWQAAGDYHRRFKDAAVFRIGGARKELQDLAELEERPSHRATRTVAYTTLHTAQRRLPAILEGVGLVVWDECHWGEHAGAGKLITACKRKRIPMLGLTATPRENSRWTVAYSNTFEELVERGWLARPVPFVAKTNEVWTPTIDARSGDFDRASLTTLANSRKRNDQIVATYKARWSHCRRTLVFACDIQHANDLAKRFNDARCPAAAVHSDNTNEANQRARREFERGDKVILVNVAMLTHGIDIPEIETIFLCRPTKSQILFSQMVGRGARKTESKHSFSIVDFVDTLNEHGDQLVTAQRYFHGTNSASIAPRLATISQPRQARHAFDPAGAPNWIAPAADVPSSVAGLWYRTGQTFGIELEFTRPDGKIPVPTSQEWLNVAKGLLEALRQALPDRVAAKPISDYAGVESGVAKDHSVWNVEYDASAGWEVTSRILAERLGFLETAVACSALEVAARNLGVDVNYKTGLHLHLGWTTSDPAVLKRLIRLVRLFEPALATLVAASRLAAFDGVRYDLQKPNPYCRPISSVATEASLRAAHDLRGIFNLFGEHDSKFVTLNVRPLMLGNGTVEIRMHSGTYESGKVLLWTSLWQQILWAANQPVEPPKVADAERIVPTGDIVALAQQYLLDQGQAQQRGFLDKLRVRRRQVVDSWSTNWQLQGWSAAANKWP